MLSFDEYFQIFDTHGQRAADAEFDRQALWDTIKIVIVILICIALSGAPFLISS